MVFNQSNQSPAPCVRKKENKDRIEAEEHFYLLLARFPGLCPLFPCLHREY